jgi:hypothetical protein
MSERYKSAEELLEQHIADMGDALGRVYNVLTTELSRLHVKWTLYRQLYAKSPARVELLNRAAAHAFSVLQGTLADDVVLHLWRLTDATRSTGRENLTVRRLPMLVPAPLRVEIEKLLTDALAACEPFRPQRHQRLAHTDYQTALSGMPVPGISRAQIETALCALGAILNCVERHYWQSPTMYDAVIVPGGDADSLVYYLLKGIRADDRRCKRFKEGTPLPEDLEDLNEEIP